MDPASDVRIQSMIKTVLADATVITIGMFTAVWLDVSQYTTLTHSMLGLAHTNSSQDRVSVEL